MGRLGWVLIVGGIAPLLDATVVNVAVDALGRSLNAPVMAVQWVITGYLLALALAVPLSGWVVRRWGAKRMWLASLLLFLLSSILCGLAWNVDSLVAFRVLQGIGGGLLQPILMTLLVQSAGGRGLGDLMAKVTLPAVVVPILGPLVGGVIVNDLSWRWVFYLNVPICLLALALAWRYLPPDEPSPGSRLDVVGLLLLSPGLAAVLYGWWIPGLVLLAGYLVHALRTSGEPLVDVRLFRVRTFAASSGVLFLAGLSMFGAMLLLPLYYQQVRGLSPVAAGLMLAPQGIGSLLPRPWAGKLTDRLGTRRVVLAGTAMTVLGTVAFTLPANTLLLGLSLVVRGAGLSMATIAVMANAFQSLHPNEVPHASTAIRIIQQLGGSCGTAVLVAILAHTTFTQTFLWTLILTAVAAIPALFLRPQPATPMDKGRLPSAARS